MKLVRVAKFNIPSNFKLVLSENFEGINIRLISEISKDYKEHMYYYNDSDSPAMTYIKIDRIIHNIIRSWEND